MIVDNHEEIRTSIARMARNWGHEVAVADDGPSAFSLADTFQPECAVVDLSLPGMNGIEWRVVCVGGFLRRSSI